MMFGETTIAEVSGYSRDRAEVRFEACFDSLFVIFFPGLNYSAVISPTRMNFHLEHHYCLHVSA